MKDEKDRFYIGSTENLERRIHQHQIGHTQTTRNMLSPKLALVQKYGTLGEARKIEQKIKKLKRRDYIEKMIVDGYIGIGV